MSLSRRTFLKTGCLYAPLMASPLMLGSGGAAAPRSPKQTWDEFTQASEKSTRRGANWLMKAYNTDDGCGVDIGTPSDLSCTAVVGLAMLSQGHSPVEGELAHLTRRSERYLLKSVANNQFSVDLRSQVRADLSGYADHHFAALMLSQSMGEGRHLKRVQSSLRKLVEQISGGQTSSGHWGKGRYPNLAAVTGWVSLRGAHSTGLNVKANADITARYLARQIKGRAKGRLFTNAAGIRVLYSMGLDQTPEAKEAFETAIRYATTKFTRFNQFGGEHYLAFHFINEAMIQAGGDYWRRWFPVVRDKLIQVQNADGSWTGYSCIVSRTFCTSCALLVLTSPNRFLPISQV